MIISIISGFIFVIAVLFIADRWVDSKLPSDIQDRLDEADEEVANRARLGDL